MRVIIDTDPGIDDVVTLALAARAPGLDLRAVITTYGNTTLAQATRNARHLLQLVNRGDVPVVPGAAAPMSRPLVTAPEAHGPTGVGYAPVPEAQPVRANPAALISLLGRETEPVTLVTLGPLTTLAHALRTDPSLVHTQVRRHVGMFGTLDQRGTATRWADFNVWADPEAADLVLRADLPTVMVGLDVTRRMTLSAAEVESFAASRDPLTAWLGQALRFYVEFHRRENRLDGCVVNDVLTVGELLSPGLLSLADVPLTVDLDEGEHRGHTRKAAEGVMTAVAVWVDVGRLRSLLNHVFRDPRK